MQKKGKSKRQPTRQKPADVADVETDAPIADPDFVDLTDLNVVEVVMVEAFANFKPPSALDKIPEHPFKKHPRDKLRRDGTRKLTPMDVQGKFSAPVCMRILKLLSISSFFRDACQCAGVTYKTGREWVKKGFKADEPVGSPYWVFAHAVVNVSAAVKGRVLRQVHRTLNMHWNSIESAKVWLSFLKMRFPRDYAEHSTVDTTSNGQTIGTGGRVLQGINIVFVDGTCATPVGHSIIEDKPEDTAGEVDSVDEMLDELR